MLKPLEDKVIIKNIQNAEEVTDSGLVVVQSAAQKPNFGEVVAVGPGMVFPDGTKLELDLKAGDKVYYAQYGGTEVTHKGETLKILQYRDIFAVVEE